MTGHNTRPRKSKTPDEVEGLTEQGRGPEISRNVLETVFALSLFTGQFASASDCFGLFTGAFYGRFFVVLLEFHLTEHTFTLQFFLQGTKRLIDIIIANLYLHVVSPPFYVKVAEVQEAAV